MRRIKRSLAAFLMLCMMLTMMPAVTFAEDQTAPSTGSAAEELMSLDGKVPNEYTKAQLTSDDGDNPMGMKSGEVRQIVKKNELFVGIHDGESGAAPKYTIYNRDKGSIDWNAHEAGTSIGGGKNTSYNHVIGSFVQAVPVDVLGNNRDDSIAYIYVTEDSELYVACDYHADGGLDSVTKVSSSEPFLSLEGDLDQWWAKNMMAITAGDYDGDGKDEVAIGYNADNGEDEGVCIRVYSFRGAGSSPGTQLCRYFNPMTGTGTGYGNYSSIDLASGDFNNDGLDDIAAIQYRGRAKNKNSSRTRLMLFTGTENSANILSSPQKSYAATTADYDFYGPSIDAGDIDGDGVEEIVVAGYEVTYTDDNAPVYDEENVRVVVSKIRKGSNTVQSRGSYTMPMNGFTKGGLFSSSDDVWSKTALACVAINGKNAPEQLFIDGYLCAIVGSELSTVYAPQYFGSSDTGVTDPRGESHAITNAYIETAAAGVYDGNEAGREQVAFSVVLKITDRDDYYFESGIIGGRKYEDEKDADGNIASYGTCTDYFSNYFEEEYVNPDGGVMLDAGDDPEYALYYTMVPVDIDDDGLYGTYEGLNYVYSDPHVDAILQAAPYFGDLIGDVDPYFGETAYEVTKSYTMEKSSSDNVSFGVTVTTGAQLGLDVGIANLDITSSIEAGYQMEWTQTFTDSLTTSYTQSFAAEGYDTVLIQRTPHLVYTYRLVSNINDGDDKAKYITYSIPQGPIYYQLSLDEYNDFVDVYNAKIDKLNVSTLTDAQKRQMVKLVKIDDEYLTNNEGDPSVYRKDWADDDHNAVNLSQSDLTLGYNAGTATNTWTTESAYSEGVETEHGFHYGMSNEFEGGLLGNGPSLGFGFSLDYKHGTGTCETTANEKSSSGTVTNIDPDDMAQWGYDESTYRAFGFRWSFGKWDVKSSDPLCKTVADPDDEDVLWWTEERIQENCNTPVFGYAVTNVTRPSAAPLKLKVSTSELNGTDSMDLTWKVPDNLNTDEITGYHVAIVDEDDKYNVIEDVLIPADVTDYTLSGLESDTEYTLAICAVTPDPAAIHTQTINGLWSNTGTDRTDKKQYTITLDYNAKHVKAVDVSYLGNIAIANGDKVPEKSLISGKAEPKDGYAIKGIVVTYTDEDGNEVTVPDAVLTDLSFHFSLKGDTVIKIIDGNAVSDGCNLSISVTETDGAPDGTLTGTVDGIAFDVTGSNVDGKVTLKAVPAKGFVLDKWEVYEADRYGEPVGEAVATFGNDGTDSYTFTPYMDDTHVKAVFARADAPEMLRTITVKKSEGGTVIVKDKSGKTLTPDSEGKIQVAKANNVTITYAADKGYTLKEWTDYIGAYEADADNIKIVVMEDFTVGATFKAPFRFTIALDTIYQNDKDGNAAEGTLDAARTDGNALDFSTGKAKVIGGTEVTFTAAAADESRIVDWSITEGSEVIDSGEFNEEIVQDFAKTVPINGNTTVEVTFRNIDEYGISVTTKNSSVVITDADGNEIKDGDEVRIFTKLTITAIPDENCTMTSLTVNGEDFENGSTIKATDDIAIVSKAKKPDHTIRFAANGGTGTMDSVIVNEEDTFTIPDCGFTAPDGKEFDGWDKGQPGEKMTILDDMVFTAQWKELPVPAKYTVKFNANGGSGEMSAVTVTEGEQYLLPACGFTAPEGKEFKGWDKGAAGDEIDVTGDMTVTAQWKDIMPPEEYTVSFAANGGSGTMDPVTVTEGEKYTLPACGFTAPNGKAFNGWDKGAAGNKIDITGDTTITAQWKDEELPAPPAVYTVKFDANGGSGTMDPATVTEGEKYTLPECGFTAPNGKEFKGWDKGAAGEKIDIAGDTTITAQWKDIENPVDPSEYTVKFDANGGGGEMSDATVIAGEKYTLPACGFTAPDNKEFDGWDLGAKGDKIDITGDTTITAQWKEIEQPAEPVVYTVTFNGNGAAGTMADETVEKNADGKYILTLPDNGFTVPDNKEFNGWDLGAANAAVEIGGDTTVTAQWKDIGLPAPPVVYTVTFDGNGAEGSMTDMTVGENADGRYMFTLPESGFTAPNDKVFSSWDLGGAETEVEITGDTVVTAQWEDIPKEVTYKVSFNGNGGTGSMADITVKANNEGKYIFELPDNGFTGPDGKEFNGWDKGAAGKEIEINADITVTAQWKAGNSLDPETYTVSFNGNGGEGSMDTVTVNAGKSYKLPANGFTAPNGKVFAGWDLGAAGRTVKIDADTTVTAQWKDEEEAGNFKVMFDGNGGSGTMESVTVKEGELYILPENGFKAPDNKKFDGWDIGIAGEKVNVSADITVTAQWRKKKQVKVTFETNGGTAVETQSVLEGNPAVKPSDPKLTDNYFRGWFKDAECTDAYDFSTPVDADITLYAKWTPNSEMTFTVTFETNRGSAVAAQTGVKYGAKATKPAAPKKDFYTFAGWYSDSKLTTAYDFNAGVVKNLTLYAKWTENPAPVLINKISSGSKKQTVTWNKVSGATKYEIYFATCSSDEAKTKYKKVKTVKAGKSLKYVNSGLKNGTSYKYYVVAYGVKDGKTQQIAKSPEGHSYCGNKNGNKKYTNAESIKVKKTSFTLKQGKSTTIKTQVSPSIKKYYRKLKLMGTSHSAAYRYISSDPRIAKVTSGGKVTGVKKGTCYIYIIAHNGVSRKIKVTVK